MARIYSPNEKHSCEYGVDFIHGAAAVPDADTATLAWFDARNYTIVAGSDTLSPWDLLPVEQLRIFAPYGGIDPAGMTKAQLVAAIETTLISLMKITIAKYDNIAFPEGVTVIDADTNKIDGGTKTTPTYESAAKIIELLPTQATATFANGVKATVAITTWADTTGYDTDKDGTGLSAKDYVFTATLGTVPTPFSAAGVTFTAKVNIGDGE